MTKQYDSAHEHIEDCDWCDNAWVYRVRTWLLCVRCYRLVRCEEIQEGPPDPQPPPQMKRKEPQWQNPAVAICERLKEIREELNDMLWDGVPFEDREGGKIIIDADRGVKEALDYFRTKSEGR